MSKDEIKYQEHLPIVKMKPDELSDSGTARGINPSLAPGETIVSPVKNDLICKNKIFHSTIQNY